MMTAPPVHHRPVMLREALQALNVRPGGRYIDATVGEGGHATAVLDASAPGGQLLGLDVDPEALEAARRRLQSYADDSLLVQANFARMGEVAHDLGFVPVHGVLLDLGLSSLQVDRERRGFSFQRPDPLDMRMDPGRPLTAADIVNTYAEEELAHLLYLYGEERQSRRIARAVARHRPIDNAQELAEVVARATGPRHGPRGRIHPATRTFQALRIAVNGELESLEEGLRQAVDLLGHGGRLVVISYHSLEDRIVKTIFREESRDCICPPDLPQCQCGHRATLRLVTRRVLTPTPEEVTDNPRARSARLRVAEHL